MLYYHVTSEDYQHGDDLLCYNELIARGYEIAWKWEYAEEGTDGDVVCLFATREEAEQFATDWQPDGQILVVNLPEQPREYNILMTQTSEGYPAVYRMIESCWISA